jgi:CBS domain-containing protein
VRVGELCVRKVEVVSPQAGVLEAARQMRDAQVGTLVVVDELMRPLGILTDRDLAVRCIAEERDARRTNVGAVMSGPVAWVHEDTALEDAVAEMARLRVRRFAVVDARERLVGLLALDDALCRELGETSPLGRAIRATM